MGRPFTESSLNMVGPDDDSEESNCSSTSSTAFSTPELGPSKSNVDEVDEPDHTFSLVSGLT
jgi:hypothetical protein